MKTIVVDPGHGGDDNGAVWGHAEEDDINLNVSFHLRCELEKHGNMVIMTRTKDKYISLAERVEIANKAKADYFISIHCDAFHKITAKGMSVHVHPNHSDEAFNLANWIRITMATEFKDHVSRGVKKSNFYVLRETKMPAILVECEFLSNPETRNFLREPENQLALARAITRGNQ